MRFYEKQEAGLGTYFLDSVGAGLDPLQLFAGIHSMPRDHHRFLADRIG